MGKNNNFIVYDDLVEHKNKSSLKPSNKGKIITIIIVVVLVAIICLFLFGNRILESVGISSKLFNSASITYGDVNDDSKVNSEDSLLILKYVNGDKKLTNAQQKRADVDGTGKVDQMDAQLILKKAVKLIDKFPIEEKKYGYKSGDVNQDGKVNAEDTLIVEKYIAGNIKLTGYQTVLADVSGDNEVTKLDAELIGYYITKKIKSFPILNPKLTYYSLGDVNEDGKVNAEDASLVNNFITGASSLTEIEKKAADINKDGKINEDDSKLILEVAAGTTVLPDNEETTDNNTTQSNNSSNNATNNNNSSSNNNSTNNNNSSSANNNNTTNNANNNSGTATIPLIYGDVNQDGNVDSQDALLVEKYYNGTIKLSDSQKTRADVNGDKAIDKLDEVLILRYAAKIIKKLGPGIKYYTVGDVNADGKINIKDVVLIGDHMSRRITLDEVEKRAADINKDGVVDARDVQILLKQVGGY